EIGPVANHRGSLDATGVPEHGLGARRGADLSVEERGRAEPGDARLPVLGVDDGPHAHPADVQWDVPEPAVLEGLDEDVGVVRPGQSLAAFVVAVDGEIAEVRVDPPEPKRPPDEAGLAARVDDVLGLELALPVVVLFGEAHADGAIAVEDRGAHPASLAH